MRKFLKIYFRFNMIFSLLLLIYTAIVFLATAFNIEPLLNIVQSIQDFTTFNIMNLSLTYLPIITLFGFFVNQYFNKIYFALFNFDKFREISGLPVILVFSAFQLISNFALFGFFALIPLIFNCLSIIFLTSYQKKNRLKYSEVTNKFQNIEDPDMQQMCLKIGQLRILKSEGKITEEEFMLHLNNILENKE